MEDRTCQRCGGPIRPGQEFWSPAGLDGRVHKQCPERERGKGPPGRSGGPGGKQESPPRPADGGGGGGIILPGEE